MPQLRDPLDTPKKNRIRGGIMGAEWIEEEQGISSTDAEIAEVFECHPETVDYVRHDDEDRTTAEERAGVAKNVAKNDIGTVLERFREDRPRTSRTSKKRKRPSSTESESEENQKAKRQKVAHQPKQKRKRTTRECMQNRKKRKRNDDGNGC